MHHEIPLESPKQRIFDAAVTLFSRKGYSATSVRELAKQANVNIAMINYYYGSKIELLKAINVKFFTEYKRIAQVSLDAPGDLSLKLQNFIRNILNYFKDNPGLMIIGLTEFPLEVPELSKFKAGYVDQIRNLFFTKIFPLLKLPEEMYPLGAVIGPALIGMMAAQFIFRPVIENFDFVEINDRFYEQAITVISEIFLNGLLSRSFIEKLEKPILGEIL